MYAYNGILKLNNIKQLKIICNNNYCDVTCILISCITLYILWQYLSCFIRRLKPARENKFKTKDDDFVYNVEECPICLNTFTEMTRASCGHAYCLECLTKHFQLNNSEWKCFCAVCKQLISGIYITKDYNSNSLNIKRKRQLEKEIKKMIKLQNSDVIIIKRLDWLFVNAWFLFYTLFIPIGLVIVLLYSVYKNLNFVYHI